jgi:hypothetical protein
MKSSWLAIEQQVLYHDVDADRLVEGLTVAEAMAPSRMANRFAYEDAVRFSNSNSGAERDVMLSGIGKLKSVLAGAGFLARRQARLQSERQAEIVR